MALRPSLLGQRGWRYTHDLLPMPYTLEAAAITAQKVREVRDFLEVPDRGRKRQQLRRIPCLGDDRVGIPDEVVERADCGILLDVNNIYVSSRNHSFDPFDLCEHVPRSRSADSYCRPLEFENTFSIPTIIR